MVEPITTVGLGAIAAYLGKDGLQKLLGPTADYLGGGLRDFTQRRFENVGAIFKNAERKLGDRANSPGTVPPKVLKEIINEGSFNDDALAAEYFGGILASSRTEHGRDDRGARIAKLVDRLSTYQLRAHYLIYSSVKHLFASASLPFNNEGRSKMKIYLPFAPYATAMDFDKNELRQGTQLLSHVFWGLHSENLLGDWSYGPKEALIKQFPGADDDSGGIICEPSALGCELYLYAFGAADQPLEFIFDPALANTVEGVPDGVPGARPAETT